MNRTILILSATSVGLVLVLVATSVYRNHAEGSLLSKPPKHGTSFVLEAELPVGSSGTNGFASLKEALARRATRFGVRIYLEPVSETRIRVFAPIIGQAEAQMARDAIGRGGMLQFRLVHEHSDQLVESGDMPAGYEALKLENVLPDGRKVSQRLLVKKEPEPGLSGNLVKHATVTHGSSGEPEISFALRQDGAAAFARVTRENVGRRVAIIMDSKVFSAPVIRSPIEGGSGVISGHFSAPEAFALACALDSPLPVPVRVVESKDF